MKFLYEDNIKNEYIITYIDNGLNVLDFWICDNSSFTKMKFNNSIDYKNYQIIISHEEEACLKNVISDRYLIRLLCSNNKILNSAYKLNSEYEIVKLTDQNYDKYQEYFSKIKELGPYDIKYNNPYYIFLLLNKKREILGVSIYKDFSESLLLEYYYINKEERGKGLGKYLISITMRLMDKDTSIMANVESTNLSSYKTLINSGFIIFNKKSYISYR